MQFNYFERLFILSPVRAFLQNHLETRRLLKMGGSIKGARVLKVDRRLAVDKKEVYLHANE